MRSFSCSLPPPRIRRLRTTLGGGIVLAFLVNVVELLCTAGFPAVYRPARMARGVTTSTLDTAEGRSYHPSAIRFLI